MEYQGQQAALQHLVLTFRLLEAEEALGLLLNTPEVEVEAGLERSGRHLLLALLGQEVGLQVRL